MHKKPSISVVIPNYNGQELLKENLPFIYSALREAGVEYEVIVPDDASTDLSLEFLRTNYPQIKIVENKINRGFAPTANSGIFAATKELLFLVNSDVKLIGDYFNQQFRYFQKEDTFGVMGRIIGLDNDRIQDAAKQQYRFGLKIGAGKNLIPKMTEKSLWFPTLYLSGANALVDRKKLMELSGLDEIYAPFYGEDLDLCLRAWKVGWKCYYEHQAICRHPNSVTIMKYNKLKEIRTIVYRNRFVMHAIHLEGIRKMAWNVQLLLQLPVKMILRKNEFMQGFRQFLNLKKEVMESKRKLLLLGDKRGTLLSNKEVFYQIKKSIEKISYRRVHPIK